MYVYPFLLSVCIRIYTLGIVFHLFVIGNMIKYSTIDTFNYKTSMFIVTLFIFFSF